MSFFRRRGRPNVVVRARLALEIVVLYGRVRRAMPRQPFGATLASLRAPLADRSGPDDRLLAYRLAWAVERVLARLPTDSRCLYRTLVLAGLLARRGIPVRVVIGVCTQPHFTAHSWIERDGEALLPTGGPGFRRLTEL